MSTVYYTASSLDGYVAAPGDDLSWLLQLGEGPPGDFDAFLGQVGAIAMGSATYLWILHNHITDSPDAPRPWPYRQPSWVFSSRALPPVEGADIRFVQGDVQPVHQQMLDVAAGRRIWVVGGGNLAAQFLDAGLLDEIVVDVASVTLGSGTPLLPRAFVTPPLLLRSVEAFPPDFARLSYAIPRPGLTA